MGRIGFRWLAGLGILAGIWTTAGCSSVVPEALRGEVDRRVTAAQLLQGPDAYRGRLVLVGGQVLRVVFLGPDVDLLLEERPLSGTDESPILAAASRGNLVVRVPGGARSAYREGQVITVVGTVTGREGPGGLLDAPRLEARHVYLWPVGWVTPRPLGSEW